MQAYPMQAGASYPVQTQANNIVVVSQQPHSITTTSHRYSNTGQGALVFAGILTVIAAVCCWWILFCTIPAIFIASSVS